VQTGNKHYLSVYDSCLYKTSNHQHISTTGIILVIQKLNYKT